MAKKIPPPDNSANIGNSNKGTPGTNKKYDQNQGNRGKQMAEPPAEKPAPPKSKK